MAALACFQVGTGLLFPWNTVLSAVDFWNDVYPNKVSSECDIAIVFLAITLIEMQSSGY